MGDTDNFGFGYSYQGYGQVDDNNVSKAYVDEMQGGIDIEQEIKAALSRSLAEELDKELTKEVQLKALYEEFAAEKDLYDEDYVDEYVAQREKEMAIAQIREEIMSCDKSIGEGILRKPAPKFTNAERNQIISELEKEPIAGEMSYDTEANQLLMFDGTETRWVAAQPETHIDLDADGIKFTVDGETMNLVDEIKNLRDRVAELEGLQEKVPATMQNPEYEISFTMDDLEPGARAISEAIKLATAQKEEAESDFDRAMKGI